MARFRLTKLSLLEIFITLYLFPFAAGAATNLDQIIGIRISQLIAQGILGSPPLPSLYENSRTHFAPQVSYIEVKANNKNAPEGYLPYTGKFHGWSAGVGLTESTRTRVGLYGFATTSSVKGGISAEVSQGSGVSSNFELKDMKNSGYNLSAGFSFRPWSVQTFPIALGFLAGPFISEFQSTFKFGDFSYSSKTFVFGPMVGVQAVIKVFGAELNPFYLQYYDLSSHCQTYSTNATNDGVSADSAKGCSVQKKEIELDGSFYSYGLNLGLFGLSFSAITKVKKDPSLESLSVKNYNFGYTFHF